MMGERGACAIQGFGCKTAEGRRAYWRVQRGLTLVELMIAATLMTMLIAGAIQLYAITRKVDVLAFQVSELYDNALYTFRELQSVVGRAGYRESVTYGSDFASTFLADDTHLFATGQVLGGTENAVSGDTVRFRFTGASTNNIRDCRGEVVRPNQVAIVELFLVDETLTCSNTVVSKPNPTLVVSGRQEVSLLRDVVNLKIRYREVTDAGQYAFQSAAR
ncbi:MAG: prepilin-type N-terminal cleavage/methylation domain-containing protein, partial [Gammaproteobacteria bacterium]